jgi:hypothetical protein
MYQQHFYKIDEMGTFKAADYGKKKKNIGALFSACS